MKECASQNKKLEPPHLNVVQMQSSLDVSDKESLQHEKCIHVAYNLKLYDHSHNIQKAGGLQTKHRSKMATYSNTYLLCSKVSQELPVLTS